MKYIYRIFLSLLFIQSFQLKAQTSPECQMIGINDPLNFNTETNIPEVFPGDQFCLELQVENFDFVISFQYTLSYDPTQFEFLSLQAIPGILLGPIAANVARSDEGLLVFIWANANAEGQTIADNTGVLNLCFEAIGEPGTTDLCFNNDLAGVTAITEVNYQIDPTTTCSDSTIFLDGNDECTDMTIECLDLRFVNLSVCNSDQNGGSIQFDVCGGSPPYNYSLNAIAPGTANAEFETIEYNNLPPGIYTIQVIDANNDVIMQDVTITSEPPLDFDFTAINPICSTIEIGEIEIHSFTGGTEPYIVTGVNMLTKQGLSTIDTAFFDRLGNGIYSITVEDAAGCTTTRDITLLTPPLEFLIDTLPASCVGANDGFVRVTPIGGVPFPNGEYSFNSVLMDAYETDMPFLDDAFNNITGQFRLEIQDNSGCPSEILTFDIPVSGSISVNITDIVDVDCNGESTGSFVLTDISPGVISDYIFPLFDETGSLVTAVGGIRNDSLIYDGTLEAGVYSVSIENLSTGCNLEETVVINEPAFPIDLTPDFIAPSCNMEDGRATVIAFGGTQSYTYNWADDPANNTNSLNNVGAGFYSVTVIDDLGCLDSLIVEVIAGGSIELEARLDNGLGCDNMGTAQASVTIVSSTTPPISVEWFDDDDMNIGSGQMQALTESGLYYVEVTSSDCVARDTIELLDGVQFTFDITITNPTCPNFNNGSAVIDNFSGGVPPYECTWVTIPFVGCDNNNLPEGNFMFSVTDADNCTVDTMITLVNELTEILFDITTVPPVCPGELSGSIIVDNISGGVGPYDCIFDDPTITSCNPNTLASGMYNFQLIDANGCRSRDTFAVVLPNMDMIDFTASVLNPQCGGALGVIDITPGTGVTLDIVWSDPSLSGLSVVDMDAGPLTATITDNSNGCSIDTIFNLINETDNFALDIQEIVPDCPDGIDGRISIVGCIGCDCMWDDPSLDAQGCNLVSLSPRIYNVTVTDPTGCQKDTFVDLSVDPDVFEIVVDPNDIVGAQCFESNDGQATASVANNPRGMNVFDFLWSNGDSETGVTEATNIQLPFGDNFVVGSDGVCTDTIFFEIIDPEELLLDRNLVTTLMTSCNMGCDGMASLAAIGGTAVAGYTFRWEDGIEAETRNDLCAGINRFTIIDDNGCETLDSVMIEDPDLLIIDTTFLTNISCFDPNSGLIRVTPSGGCSDFMFEWTNDVSDTDTAENLPAGTYTVSVTDACGCVQESTFVLEESEMFDITPVIPATPNCAGERVALGIESVNGGTNDGFTYSINFGNRMDIDSLDFNLPGDYILTVFDAVGCSSTAVVTIDQPNNFSVETGPDLEISLGESNVIVTANTIGGQEPLTFDWISNFDFLCDNTECSVIEAQPNDNFANYEVVVTDANGCVTSDDITIEVRADRNVYIPNTFRPEGFAPNNRFMLLTGTGVERVDFLTIFDRYGNPVFQVEDIPAPTSIDLGWDGRRGTGANSEVEAGVYVYLAEVTFIDGVTIQYSGSVTLIR